MAATEKKGQKYNFDKICRACLQIKKDMRPLFEQLTATMLMGISKVQVAIDDGLPKQLCLQCVHQISRCYTFKESIERNDVMLQEQKRQEEGGLQKDQLQDHIETSSYIQFIEVPSLNSNQNILDGFFDNTDTTDVTQEILQKEDFDIDKLQTIPDQPKEDEALNSDEENYLQMVVFQSTTTAAGRHVCNLCHKEFKHARWLKQHLKSHTNWIKANCKKPPKCPICDRTFKGPGMLKMHMRTHEQRPPKQPTCSVCQRTFQTKTLLYRHRQTHFEQKSHQCTVCEKRFFSGYALRSHMARHRGERPFTCAVCSKTFYNPTDLKVHFRLHTGEKPLKCSECNKAFRRHSTLCQHMKKHRGIKNHVCNICNKAFYEVSKLNAHMRIHTGERPFECQYCDRRFAQQSALIYHRRTHTGEKPYSCKLCSAKFTTSSARNNHLLIHTGHKKLVCPICLKTCKSRTELRLHTNKHAASGASKKNVKAQGSKPEETIEAEKTDERDENNEEETEELEAPAKKDQETQALIRTECGQRRFKCGLCVKSYMYLHSLKKHLLSHVQMCVFNSDGSEKMYALRQQQQQQQQQQHQQQQQQQQPQIQQLLQVQPQQVQQQVVQQLTLPIHQHIQNVQQPYPVISSVQSLQLQQTHQHINTQPQQLQVQTIQLQPHQQPIQLHAVGMQQEQLHVASSSCQTMLPNILQLQNGTVVSGLSAQELNGVAHRIILQQPPPHPAVYTIHH
ncbi:zinc finger protein 436-like isoform X3 [Pieris napi]|uniref:zinc finger protein 436-like isoform X3 n=1 Tax=Pieris napi TaxID=78633 RepID=UPI001FBBF24D|nr:zinc finger protein 436-like isoform X3 [Pieris napi]